MLITSRETRRWIIPKGWAENGIEPHVVAAKEAYEEAGVVGEIGTEPIATYRYQKLLPKGRACSCKVQVFSLAVTRQLDNWPERNQRDTCWLTPAEAAMQVEEGGLVRLLLTLAGKSE